MHGSRPRRGGSLSYFVPYLQRWQLTIDGDGLRTTASRLLPVRRAGRAGMLKIALHEEERRGGALMRWWPSDAMAPVWEQQGNALLMARASGTRSLLTMATQASDDEASAILCTVAAGCTRHRPRRREPRYRSRAGSRH